MAVDLSLVRHALTVARDAEFASVELESLNITFSAEFGRGAPRAAPIPLPTSSEPTLTDTSVVKCLLVGYFGLAPTPIKVGERISVGDLIGIVTALGIPNEVVADVAGSVDHIFVADGDPVEYGQPLIRVKPE